MSEALQVAEVRPDDPGLVASLAAAGLPVDDLAEPGRHFFVFSSGIGKVGYAGWEEAGDAVLLRSLVVLDGMRGRGFGRQITEWLLARLAGAGNSAVYFLTTSAAAAALGERTGFARADRALAPASIQATRQFSGLCPSNAILMTLRRDPMQPNEMRDLVRTKYGEVATQASASGCCGPTGCDCGGGKDLADKTRLMGYSEDDLAAAPDGANLGLGCGNPQAIASLKPGEVVVDLGSGAGFDCFLAARQVGPQGRVIGVDMTHEMLAKARENSAKAGAANVEFRLGEIEHLPLADGSADVVISNCVINLSPDKPQVFREAFRVLKKGGRIAVSDVVNMAPLPPHLAGDPGLLSGCVAGASTRAEIEGWLREAGFVDVAVSVKAQSRDLIKDWAPGSRVEDYVASAAIEARKP